MDMNREWETYRGNVRQRLEKFFLESRNSSRIKEREVLTLNFKFFFFFNCLSVYTSSVVPGATSAIGQ